ncbi:MAG: replication initiator protein [Microviridae sp.]|nr:MAG: replication initiator protein [Microviridae sp.]
MCLFALPNTMVTSTAYRKGVTAFKCGACPECMRERSSVWALRAVYEAKRHLHNCMITLTYDTFKYDSRGRVIGENPVNSNLIVNKSHIQLFMKRLRKKFGKDIKYIACAEYGSRTHRAHYHLILFNVRFPDLVFYKRSKRGNPIYQSHILTELWMHGICTVDSINVYSAVARYCTKYCAKSRSANTFMLFSQGIGVEKLLEDFNGLYYMVDGRKYTIPRVVWQKYISNKYAGSPVDFDYRYVNFNGSWSDFLSSAERRQRYFVIRDNDSVYQKYIAYWKFYSKLYEAGRDTIEHRIYALADGKYHNYKVAALEANARRCFGVPVPSPGSNQKSAYERYYFETLRKLGLRHLPLGSRPNTASDTKRVDFKDFKELKSFVLMRKALYERLYSEKYLQLSYL